MSPPPESTHGNTVDTTQIWDELAGCVDQFAAAWERAATPPSLAEFLPDSSAPARRLTLVELIKIDLELRWQRQDATRLLEDYIRQFPELVTNGDVPSDLLYEEFVVRNRYGRRVDPQEYHERFPAQAETLGRLFALDAGTATSSLMATRRPDNIEVGDRLDDFELLTRIGQGAFASVFLARQCSLQRLVALKVSANRGTEPQTLAQLDHPNIVRVFDQRIIEERQWRLLYMEYVAGGTLQDVIEHRRRSEDSTPGGRLLLVAVDSALQRGGQMPSAQSTGQSTGRQSLAEWDWPTTVCWVGMQLADALDYAHRHGVLHRDVKPANILLAPDGVPKLVDFNISSCTKLDGATPAAYFGGSLAYMSPEHLQACNPNDAREPDSLDRRSDLYALGVVLWELLAGRRPYADPTDALTGGWSECLSEMARRRSDGPTRSMLDQLPLDPQHRLRQILSRCLEGEPQRRYASASELADQLDLCLRPDALPLFPTAVGRWRIGVRNLVPVWVALFALVPNALAGVFNYFYNRQTIIAKLESAEEIFWWVQFVINSLAFPLGMAVLVVLSLPVARAARQRSGSASTTGHFAARKRALHLGRYAALTGIVEWLICGMVYPVALHIAGVALSWPEYLHFIGSLALCGMVAATYPYFGITALSVHVVYPGLLEGSPANDEDVRGLDRLHRATWRYLVLAALLPMLGVMLLVALGGDQNRFPLAVLSTAGFVGFGLVCWLTRFIQRDLAALLDVIGHWARRAVDSQR